MEWKLLFNGKIEDEHVFRFSPCSRVLHFGDGVFETMRSYSGKIFRFHEHIVRMKKALDILEMKLDVDISRLMAETVNLLNINSVSDGRIKIMAFRQTEDWPGVGNGTEASYIILVRPFKCEVENNVCKTISACIAEDRRNPRSKLTFIKSLNYLENMLAKIEAQKRGFDEAVFLNIFNHVTEGSISNLFLVKGGKLITPSVSSGILNGITRQAVLAEAAEAGIIVSERDVTLEELSAADEVFLTNSIIEIMPMVKLGDSLIGDGRAGQVTLSLALLYKNLVKKELGVE